MSVKRKSSRNTSESCTEIHRFRRAILLLLLLFLQVLAAGEVALGKDFTFVVMSDSHLMKKDGLYDMYAPTRIIVNRITTQIKPAFVIHCGDMVSITPRTDSKAIEPMWKLFNREVRDRITGAGVPFFPSPGNHDIYGKGREIYTRIWKDYTNRGIALLSGDYTRSYAFQYEDCLFISVDGSGISLSKATMSWISTMLGTYGKKAAHLFLITHVGFIGKGRHLGDVLQGDARKLLNDRRIEFILSGHQHLYSRDKLGSITHIIAGSAGETYPYEYLIFTVSNNKVQWKVENSGEGSVK